MKKSISRAAFDEGCLHETNRYESVDSAQSIAKRDETGYLRPLKTKIDRIEQ
jgi:hypothetical protein